MSISDTEINDYSRKKKKNIPITNSVAEAVSVLLAVWNLCSFRIFDQSHFVPLGISFVSLIYHLLMHSYYQNIIYKLKME